MQNDIKQHGYVDEAKGQVPLAAPTGSEATCGKCGKPMRWNVPRLGPAGGFVHAETGQLLCEPEYGFTRKNHLIFLTVPTFDGCQVIGEATHGLSESTARRLRDELNALLPPNDQAMARRD